MGPKRFGRMPATMTRLLLPLLVAACASGGRGSASLETSGAWVRTFETDRDTAYHAAIRVLVAEGYTIEWTNPMAGSVTAQSTVTTTLGVHHYTRARIDVEGGRVRISLIRARERHGQGRQPNNDRPVSERAVYERLFDKIAAEIGG